MSLSDDKSIIDDEQLFRRIPPEWVVDDPKTGGKRPSSQAFQDNRDGSPMSVQLQEVLEENQIPVETIIEGHENFSVASITAGFARKNSQGIIRAPLDNDPAHAEVFGKKPKSVMRNFSHNSIWIIPPK